jgi:hypothetical protein
MKIKLYISKPIKTKILAMNKPLFTGIFFLIFYLASGQTAGPNSGSVFVNTPLSGSCKSWVNFKALASDDTYAGYDSLTGADPCYSDYMKATGFNFSIPGGTIIRGIIVEVERSDPDQRTADYRIRIVKGGAIGTTERSTGIAYPATDAYQAYGGCNDLWGEVWTNADINSSTFGVAIAAIRTATGANQGMVDHIRITVCYNFIILPVKIISFDARKNGAVTDITWETVEETDINRYELERSLDGSLFETVKTVLSRNNTGASIYSISDSRPAKGINYYRLKIIENSGRISYSRIATVHFASGKNIVIYPTILQKGEELFISNLNGDLIAASFYDSNGHLVGQIQSAARKIPASLLKHTRGMVYYILRDREGMIITKGNLQVY